MNHVRRAWRAQRGGLAELEEEVTALRAELEKADG